MRSAGAMKTQVSHQIHLNNSLIQVTTVADREKYGCYEDPGDPPEPPEQQSASQHHLHVRDHLPRTWRLQHAAQRSVYRHNN